MSIAVREDLVFFFFASVVVHKIKGTTVPDEGACYFMMYRTPQSLPHTKRERERHARGRRRASVVAPPRASQKYHHQPWAPGRLGPLTKALIKEYIKNTA